MNTTNTIPEVEELKRLRAQLEENEKQILEKINLELKSLPARYGYASMSEFVKALSGLEEVSRVAPEAQKPSSNQGKKVAPEKVEQVIALLNTPNQTTKKIATACGISISKVSGIKKAAGLVKPRASSASQT
jgi:hypothetical protein